MSEFKYGIKMTVIDGLEIEIRGVEKESFLEFYIWLREYLGESPTVKRVLYRRLGLVQEEAQNEQASIKTEIRKILGVE